MWKTQQSTPQFVHLLNRLPFTNIGHYSQNAQNEFVLIICETIPNAWLVLELVSRWICIRMVYEGLSRKFVLLMFHQWASLSTTHNVQVMAFVYTFSPNYWKYAGFQNSQLCRGFIFCIVIICSSVEYWQRIKFTITQWFVSNQFVLMYSVNCAWVFMQCERFLNVTVDLFR